jgi:signal peptide peptidase SppA
MSRNRYAHLVGFALDHPWALTPGMLRIVATILGDRIAGIGPEQHALDAALAARKNDLPQPAKGGVAIIPMYGVLSPRANMLSESSGGTSFERLSSQLREAAARSDVKTIVIDCDSPGGSCAGASEFAALLRDVRTRKPVIAQANHQMASAAYWVLANATKIHASPSAYVGSIGVFSIHNDLTEALGKVGVKRTFISAGKFKLEGVDGAPLTEEGHAARTEQVTRTYDRMVGDIAKGRGATAAAVRGGYGEGRIVDADKALELGMVDKLCTLDETLDRLLPAGASADLAALHQRDDTAQEPSPATAQDLAADASWQSRIARDLLEWSLSDLNVRENGV